MRITRSVVRVLAAGIVVAAIHSPPAIGASGDGETPIPIRDRVFFNRDALRSDLSDLLMPTVVTSAPAIVAVPDADGVREDEGRRGTQRVGSAIVVASLSLSKGADSGPRLWGEASPLPWAPTPAVPPLLSKPVPKIAKHVPPAAKLPVLEEPVAHAPSTSELATHILEEAVEKRARDKVRPHLLEAHRAQSERGQPALSKLPLKRMSTPWVDPLASLEVDDDKPAAEFIMPFANGRVTSLYNQGRRHPAIDLAGALGSTVVATTSRQTVVYAAWRGGYGNAVITRDTYGWIHLYGHLRSITARVGQVLDQGDQLGHLGSTGYSTGPHVHYEVRDARGAHVNPVTVLFPDRSVRTGLAWTDVGQFSASPQIASRTASADRVASAEVIAKVPSHASAKRKPVYKQRKATRNARYVQRVRRRVASYNED
jgi:murein DD-endopeptidase MepM/ murein hydrolase activator NlpD